ncbi:hypothetical protein Pr1d_13710 [Bythopirellula goksoeyrii]|uniref:Uncharacterized protein n=1 Tax=Bythopirellula goksoeyrii TaxID=1400387 RepID=A0A5B9Q8T9_9BACT|nr:hypothetical protein Pr1d_13710 [Bythopirellula goksoeyrii]
MRYVIAAHQRSQSIAGLLALELRAEGFWRFGRASSGSFSGVFSQKLHKSEKEAFSHVFTLQRFAAIPDERNELFVFWDFDFQETERDNTTPTVRRSEIESSSFHSRETGMPNAQLTTDR